MYNNPILLSCKKQDDSCKKSISNFFIYFIFLPFCRLPDDHVVDLEQDIGLNFASMLWNLQTSFLSWDLVNYIINDLTYSGLKNWLIQDDNQTLFNGIIPDQKITISIMVGNSLETSKRFILQRYLSPGYYFKNTFSEHELIIRQTLLAN